MIKLQGQQGFHVDLDAFAEKLGILKATVYQRTTLELWNGITLRTPVDTGRARSSWNLSIGHPNPGTPAAGTYGPPGTPNVGAITGEEVVWITSNLDYIQPLENGHSKQAPAGMVFVTVNEVVSRIQLIMEKMQ